MKFIVHKDVATWMRETYEVEVDNDCAFKSDTIKNAVNGGVDDRVVVLSAGTPEHEAEVQGMEAKWTFVRAEPKLSMDDYVRRHLAHGSRGGFASNLADAWCQADSTNRRRLEQGFADIFTIPEN